MRIMRADLVSGGASLVDRYADVTTTVGSAFCTAAAREAERLRGRVEVVGGPLSGRAVATVYDAAGAAVARYATEWPPEDDES